jgi:anti-sigma B factor antagonist
MEGRKMEVPLLVNVKEERGAILVSVSGELDLWTSTRLQEVFNSADSFDNNRLELDLSNVTFLDSEGLKMLVAAYRSLDMHNKKMVITACSQYVSRVLRLSGVDSLLYFEMGCSNE